VGAWLALPIQLDVPGSPRSGPKLLARQPGDQLLGVKHGFGLEHEIDGAGQLDGQHGVGLEFVAVVPGLKGSVPANG
jgi:hypothetical protein